MRDLVIFHYHLLPGGVTTVIIQGLIALFQSDNPPESVVLAAGREDNCADVVARIESSAPSSRGRIRVDVVDGLDYGTTGPAAADLSARYGGRLWWVHNHHLGKNPGFTRTMVDVAMAGNQDILFQIHDFPECGRFNNLAAITRALGERPRYPFNPRVRYAVINPRDYRLLLTAGLPEEAVHYLPNPVVTQNYPASSPDIRGRLASTWGTTLGETPLMVYPVRAIRRKNVLEAGLLAKLSGHHLAVTLPGTSSQEKPYNDAVAQAFDHGIIDGTWDATGALEGSGLGFIDLALDADLIVSTSVQEGFGYLFTDALLWRVPLVSRDLDIIDTGPVRDESYLYNDLWVPAYSGLVSRTREDYDRFLTSLGATIPAFDHQRIRDGLSRRIRGDRVEFSYLAPNAQVEVLRRLDEPGYRREAEALNTAVFGQIVKRSGRRGKDLKQEVEERYGYDAFAQGAQSVMARFGVGPSGTGDSATVEKTFRQPPYFRLLYA